MLAGVYDDVKLQLKKLGRMNSELKKLVDECLRDLDQANNYEKLFMNTPKALADTQNGIIQNTRDIVKICVPRIKGTTIQLTTSDINEIKHKLDENDQLLNKFQALVKESIK